MAKYRLRYFFDAGAGVCLWAANDAARESFDYAVDATALPLPDNTRRRVSSMCAWFDTSLDWSYPPGPSPWGVEEGAQFKAEAGELLALLRGQLGEEFEIIDETGAWGSA
jgi:hypothetical protein